MDSNNTRAEGAKHLQLHRNLYDGSVREAGRAARQRNRPISDADASHDGVFWGRRDKELWRAGWNEQDTKMLAANTRHLTSLVGRLASAA